jgi:hypothetical protein
MRRPYKALDGLPRPGGGTLRVFPSKICTILRKPALYRALGGSSGTGWQISSIEDVALTTPYPLMKFDSKRTPITHPHDALKL